VITRLTAFCLGHRLLVAGVWIALIGLGLAGSLRLTSVLSSGFSLPGTDSNRVKQVLASDFEIRSGTRFVLIAEGERALPRVRHAAKQAAAVLPGGTVKGSESLPSGAAVSFVQSRLQGAPASARVGLLRDRVGPGIHVTGDAAIAHDLGPVLSRDLRVGELYLAVPVALVLLLLVFGSASALLPFLFAAATIPPALGIAWGVAHVLELSDYLRNMVLMIGLGIAIDYSLLVVNRYRDERRAGRAHEQAVVETMVHAGRTIVFSGLVVSLGLALMLLLPVPFLRGFGVGGLLVPLVSIVCALTLLPVMLASLGERLEGLRIVPRRLSERQHAGELRLGAAHTGWVIREVAGAANRIGARGRRAAADRDPRRPGLCRQPSARDAGGEGAEDPRAGRQERRARPDHGDRRQRQEGRRARALGGGRPPRPPASRRPGDSERLAGAP
jgi:RND superfamily putative drug exporter